VAARGATDEVDDLPVLLGRGEVEPAQARRRIEASSRFDPPPRLRGLYLASAEQDGQVVDLVGRTASPGRAGRGRSCGGRPRSRGRSAAGRGRSGGSRCDQLALVAEPLHEALGEITASSRFDPPPRLRGLYL
jgi:type VI protein secretion system component VasK